MTVAQSKVKGEQAQAEYLYEYRAFRKKCVTQGIVTFNRDYDGSYYLVKYRGMYVTMLFGDEDNKSKLRAVWNVIRTAERLMESKE